VSRRTLDVGESATFRGTASGGKLLAVSDGQGRWKNGGPVHDCSPGQNVNVAPGSSVELWNTGDDPLRIFEIDLGDDDADAPWEGKRYARA